MNKYLKIINIIKKRGSNYILIKFKIINRKFKIKCLLSIIYYLFNNSYKKQRGCSLTGLAKENLDINRLSSEVYSGV